MRVTLKKAAALSTALLALPTVVPNSLQISIYSDAEVEPMVKEADQSITTATRAVLANITAAYEIRQLIGEKNKGEISKLLTDRAYTDKKLAVLNALVNDAKMPDYDAVKRKMDALREQKDSYRSVEAISIVVPTNEVFIQEIKALKKERIKIEDRLAELNFQTTVELPADVVQVLRDNDLI